MSLGLVGEEFNRNAVLLDLISWRSSSGRVDRAVVDVGPVVGNVLEKATFSDWMSCPHFVDDLDRSYCS